MIYLFLSILFSTLTVTYFKIFELKKVQTFQAIIVNYITCGVIGTSFSERAIWHPEVYSSPILLYTFILGFLFISIFYCIALTAQKISVSASMVAAKLSVVVPVVLAWLLYQEHITWMQIVGILLSLAAVYFISRKEQSIHQKGWVLLLLPALVFMGSGSIDSLLNYLEKTFVPAFSADEIVTCTFIFAFLLGLTFFVYRSQKGADKFELKSVYWGIALGIPNYFSMYFLVKTLGSFPATFIFPIINIGIVVMSTLIAFLFFKEHLSKINMLGMALAFIAILLISLS